MNDGGDDHNVNGYMRHLEKLYVESGCDVDQTRNAICHELLAGNKEHANDDARKYYDNWVEIQMAIEIDAIDAAFITATTVDDEETTQVKGISYQKTEDKRGILLQKCKMDGEGPIHSHHQWNTVIVPEWAIGKPYFFQVTNSSVLNLSCEMSIDRDENKVARNVPLPGTTRRMIRPDNNRYFQCHKWILQPAKRVKLANLSEMQKGDKGKDCNKQFISKSTTKKRYNNIRPKYNGDRINTIDYPDPTNYNWIFTGSNEEGKVEFFEKALNFGVVKLDFYYTTGTVKTTLVHPTTGPNCLFRNSVTPDTYIQILQNPRVHTNRGYRSRSDRKNGDNNELLAMMVDSEDEEDDNCNGNNGDDTSMIGDDIQATPCPYFARNDKYDFDNEGHSNRKEAMARMEKTKAFSAWEDAAKKEWACIQAKFYVSLPSRTQNHNKGHRGRQSFKKQKSQKEDLPEQAPIVDIKAAERATLGTDFHATGPSVQPSRRSKVVMKRINGLNESDDCRAAPVFEYKLFYRAEAEIIDGVKNGEVEMDSDDDDESEIPLSTTLLDINDLSEYKQKRIHQLRNWHQSFTFRDNEEGEFVLNNREMLINTADTVKKIDDVVQEYYQWLQKEQWMRGQHHKT